MLDVSQLQFDGFDAIKRPFLEQYRELGGNLTLAAKAIGYDRTRIYQLKKDDPKFATAIEDIWEDIVGIVEAKAWEHIQKGNVTMLIFFLKTRVHEKWGNKTQLSGDKENPLFVKTESNLTPEDETIIQQAIQYATDRADTYDSENNGHQREAQRIG
ncbi:hypothetical protein HYW83_00035 [Candidatus Peregrinibacteria bacterium]|nr:hypothetical protein [Candidatus Peregrinibacteria bacterium]